jgi:hypothetical protein
MNFCEGVLHVLADESKIRCKIFSHNAFEHVEFHENRHREANTSLKGLSDILKHLESKGSFGTVLGNTQLAVLFLSKVYKRCG